MFATCGLVVQDLPATKRDLRLRDSLKIFPDLKYLVVSQENCMKGFNPLRN